MTHTVHMDFPIRPGTARRLGLRAPRPRGLIEIDIELPQAELDQFAERFRAAAAAADMTRHTVLTLDNRPALRLTYGSAPRRRWWQRRNR